jgi:4'-phosphopantetheinyl transferase
LTIYWLEQTESDVPGDDRWLSAWERARFNGMRFAKRRADWRLGRWTAKRAVAAHLHLDCDLDALAHIEVTVAASGAPELLLDGHPAEVGISLSHRAGVALCAIGPLDAPFGCDLEMIEPRSDAFVADYFSDKEKELIDQALPPDRFELIALLWSVKESVLKALRIGLRADTRSVCVDSLRKEDAAELPAKLLWPGNSDCWHPLRACYSGTQDFHGWWRAEDGFLKTVASNRQLQPPVCIPYQTFCSASS